MRLLWYLLPDFAMRLVIVVAALLLILGVLKRGAALSIIGGVLAYLLFAPFVGVVLDMLPWWVSPLLLIAFVMSVLRAASSFFLGDRASDHMVGILAADLVRGFFRLLFLPFRLLSKFTRTY